MPGENFADDNIVFPYPVGTDLSDEVREVVIDQVNPRGYVGVDDEHSHHFVAWVPLEAGGTLRTMTRQATDRVKPSYVQSEGGVNITVGSGEDSDESEKSDDSRNDPENLVGQRVAVFVLEKTLDSSHETA